MKRKEAAVFLFKLKVTLVMPPEPKVNLCNNIPIFSYPYNDNIRQVGISWDRGC